MRSKSIVLLPLYMLLALALTVTSAYALPIAGTGSGKFINPTLEPDAVLGSTVTGVGTNNIKWGDGLPGQSSMKFEGNMFATTTGMPFSVGTLSYYNGINVLNSGITAVDLALDINFTDPAGVLQSFTYNLQTVTTSNVGTPSENADYVYLPTVFSPRTFNAGGYEYTLQMLGFDNPLGEGFNNISQFHVYENCFTEGDLYAQVTVSETNVIPEASSVALALSGLPGFAAVAWRRFRK